MSRRKGRKVMSGLSLLIPPDMKTTIERIAEEDDRSISEWIRLTLRQALAEHARADVPPLPPDSR